MYAFAGKHSAVLFPSMFLHVVSALTLVERLQAYFGLEVSF